MNEIIELADKLAAKDMTKARLLETIERRLIYISHDMQKCKMMREYDDAGIQEEVKRLAEHLERLAVFGRELANKYTGEPWISLSKVEMAADIGPIVEHEEELFPQQTSSLG